MIQMYGFKISLNAFRARLSAFTNRVRNSDPLVQNRQAVVLAQIYKNKLRLGVGDKLSPLTRALHGEHPPLSTLAEHVIVKTARTGHPAAVTFEKVGNRSFTTIAWMMENGYVIDISRFPQLRAQLFAMALRNTGLSNINQIINDPMGAAVPWVVPARPHIHLMTGAETLKLMDSVARWTLFNEPLTGVSKKALYYLKNTKSVVRGEFQREVQHANIDDVPI